MNFIISAVVFILLIGTLSMGSAMYQTFPFIIAVIFGYVLSLRGRVVTLEETVKILQAGAPVRTEASLFIAPEVPAGAAQASQEVSSSVRPSQIQSIPAGNSFALWVKEDWLLKLGALILIIGFGLFLVVIGSMFGPLGRVTLGIVAGASILLFGWIRMAKFVKQGSIFLVLGSVVIILSAFTATYGYKIFPAEASLVIMFLSSAFVALASVRYHLLPLAVTSLLLASFAPTLLLSGVSPQYTELFAYLFIVTFGVIWVVALTGWRVLTLAALIVFTLYSLPHLGGAFGNAKESVMLWYAYAFTVLFFLTNTAGILKAREGDIKPDAIAAGWNGVLLLAWIMTNVSQEWKSLVIVGWMAVFIVTAFIVFAITKRREPFFVYAGVGIMMLATATAVELHGIGMVIAFIIESATLPFIAYIIMRDKAIAERLSALTAGPAILALPSMMVNWHAGIPFDHFFVLLLMSATLLLLGVFFMALPKDEGEEPSQVPAVLLIAGSIFGYVLLWLSLHATMAETSATMLSLTVYAIIGFTTYAYGKKSDQKPISSYGTVLLTFVAGHLILIESFRDGNIFIFFIVGAVLVATAFIGRKKHPVAPSA